MNDEDGYQIYVEHHIDDLMNSFIEDNENLFEEHCLKKYESYLQYGIDRSDEEIERDRLEELDKEN
jgi:hypothetical protein